MNTSVMVGPVAASRLTDLKFSDPVYHADPYPQLAELRRTAGFAKADLGILGKAIVVLRHSDVHTVFTDERFSIDPSNRPGVPRLDRWWVPRIVQLLASSMLNKDNPDHRRLRLLVHKAFTPRVVKDLERDIERHAVELLDGCAAKPVSDFIEDFAFPMPLMVISKMLGIPPSEDVRFRRMMRKLVDGYYDNPIGALMRIPNTMRITRLLEDIVALRRRQPDDNVVSALIAAEEAGDRLQPDELLSMIFLLLLAGFETSANLLGNGLLMLLDHPEQRQLLAANPNLMDGAVEEMLRYDSPVHYPIVRSPLEDLELGGMPLRKGQAVLGLLGSANRDETVFSRPDEFDIQRKSNQHLSFGMGIHFCLGAQLARIEARAAFRVLLERFPRVRLAVPRTQIERYMSAGFRGVSALPISTS